MNQRLPTRTGVKPCSIESSITTAVQTAGDGPHPRGSNLERSREFTSTAVCVSDFHGPKERWNPQAGNKSESSEQIHKTSAFQDGRGAGDQGSPAKRGLDGNVSKGCWHPPSI